MHNMASGVGR